MTSVASPLAVRVLTTYDATARQSAIAANIQNAGGLKKSSWSFWYAQPYEKYGFRYDDELAYFYKGRTLSPAELSCFASHIALVESWLKEDNSAILLVLEDDVYLDPWYDFEALAEMASAVGLDYLKLYARTTVPAKTISYVARTQVVRFLWSPSGTQAYMLTRAGAQRLVETSRSHGIITRPIDDLMDRPWETGNAVYGIFPTPVLEHNLPSIVHRRSQIAIRKESQTFLERRLQTDTRHRIRRKVSALLESISRRIAEARLSRVDAAVSRTLSEYMNGEGFKNLHLTHL